jgi:hypothetical protein
MKLLFIDEIDREEAALAIGASSFPRATLFELFIDSSFCLIESCLPRRPLTTERSSCS